MRRPSRGLLIGAAIAAFAAAGGASAQQLKVGESYQVPPGTIHDARTGPNGAKVLATYVVEKSKPLATPAP